VYVAPLKEKIKIYQNFQITTPKGKTTKPVSKKIQLSYIERKIIYRVCVGEKTKGRWNERISKEELMEETRVGESFFLNNCRDALIVRIL
jgi:hypothetical protein